jgi:C4-dicarboxylate transporter DctM subunit
VTYAIVISFVVLIAAGLPVAFVLGMSAATGILLSPDGADYLPALPQALFNMFNSFTFVTIPLFVFAGSIMAEGGVAKSLMELASVTVGRGRGGLGSSVVVATLFFSGISGSSTADTAAIGKITLPSLRQQGYPAPFATAILAASGATAALVPPSMDFILIGVVANISIAGLFAGGIIPACVNAAGLIAYILYRSYQRGYGTQQRSWSLVEIIVVALKAIPALIMMLIILGGILGGVFTPTEASAVAVAYGLVVTAVYYRTLTPTRLVAIMRDTIQISGVVLLVISMGALLGYTLTIFQVPAGVAEALDRLTDSKIVFLLLVQILFFIIGMFMDTTPAILILMPILTPIAVARGIEPIHFGILVETNIALGFATPPVGSCLFTACAVAKIPIETVVRPLLPMILVLVATMMIITYEGEITMVLPRLFNLTN